MSLDLDAARIILLLHMENKYKTHYNILYAHKHLKLNSIFSCLFFLCMSMHAAHIRYKLSMCGIEPQWNLNGYLY